MHPFVALMRRYCIDYTNTHDQSVCDDIMEPDYVVHISGFDLTRDESYKPAVADLYERAPGLGLVVHEFVLDGDRLCMRFSEHASMPAETGRALTCWKGIGLYKWNGSRLTENYVEQDHLGMMRQIDTGVSDTLEPPHLDPWMATEAVAPDSEAEAAVRSWLLEGSFEDAGDLHLDGGAAAGDTGLVVEPSTVVVDDLFSAGRRVPFHVTVTGPYVGGAYGVDDSHLGAEVTLCVAGIADVGLDGGIGRVHAVSSRSAVRFQLTGAAPI